MERRAFLKGAGVVAGAALAGAVLSPSPASAVSFGVPIYPGDDWAAVFASRPAGTTFLAKAGRHAPATSGIVVPSFTTINSEPGTVLDGGGTVSQALQGSADSQVGVVLRGLEVVGFTTGIHPGHGWQLEDLDVHSCTKGVQLNSGLRVYGGKYHDCPTYGLAGSGTDWLVQGAEIAFCGGTPDSGGSSGGAKVSHLSNGAFVGCEAHDNYGPGLWSDGDCYTDYLKNHCYGNRGPGIDHEMSMAGFTIAYNVLEGNASGAVGKSAWYGGQILVIEAGNGEVKKNLVRDTLGSNGVILRNDNRGVSPVNIDVSENDVYLDPGGEAGMVGPFDGTTTWRKNRYHAGAPNGLYFYAAGNDQTWAEWQALGYDTDGSFGL